MFRKTPISWLQLRHQTAQTIAAALGISFITVLLFMQIGFRASFLNTLTDLPASFQGDIYLLNASTVTILRAPSFSQRRLYQTLAFDEVESVTPIYWTAVLMRDPLGEPRYLRKIQAVGFPLADNPIAIPGVEENLEKLKRRKVFLIDERSRKEFLPVIEDVREKGHHSIEIRAANKQSRIEVEGLFPLGVNSSANSHIFTSDATFMDVFSRDRSRINVGLVTLKDGADVDDVVEKIRAYLPEDVMVLSKEQILTAERTHYEYGTPIGLIFRFGLGGAVVVGIVILYQILFQIISKYLRDYATMKAIGFSTFALKSIVLKAALLLAVIGYLPGLGLSFYMYSVLTEATSLQFVMSFDVSVLVLLAICFICFISALFAIRKLKDADPADLFG